MKALEVGAVGEELGFEFPLGQIQFGADDVGAITEAFEALLGVPIEKAGAAVDQISERTDHFMAAHVLDLSANRLVSWIGALVDSHNLRTDLIGVETVTLIQNPEIRSKPRTTSHPISQTFSDCFVRAAD